MTASSPTPLEKARKAHSALLQALQEGGKQGAIAVALGVSDSTVSRIKTEKVEDALNLLYLAGFKLVPADAKCYPADYVTALHTMARMHMTAAKSLEWDE